IAETGRQQDERWGPQQRANQRPEREDNAGKPHKTGDHIERQPCAWQKPAADDRSRRVTIEPGTPVGKTTALELPSHSRPRERRAAENATYSPQTNITNEDPKGTRANRRRCIEIAALDEEARADAREILRQKCPEE